MKNHVSANPPDVLLAEDEFNILLSLEYILRNNNYTVTTAQTGKEALEKIRLLKPRYLIIDLMLPEIDGFEIIRRVKQEEKSNIRIIVLSALGGSQDIERAKKLGAEEYVVKPYNPEKILEILELFEKEGA